MKNYTINKLKELNIDPNVINRYDEPHRFYHTWEHINDLLTKAKERNILTDKLFLAIVFHDIIYNPKNFNNEELSADLFYSYIKDNDVKQAILETKTHKATSELSGNLCRLDLEILNSNYETFIDFEHKIFKEYQFLDIKFYKEKRVNFLEDMWIKPEYINYVKYKKYNIGLYCGSFNPFHKGHLNILEKSEKIFDKVIIAKGNNPEKRNSEFKIPELISNRQIESYDGLLTDFINKLGYDITLIRGIRNGNDLQYEMNQYRYLQDLKKDIKVINIICDREYDYISSSSIRNLQNYVNCDDYLV